MPMLLMVGIVLTGMPLLLIIGFASFIFFGFINDDKDARGVFNIVLIVMFIGIAMILATVLTDVFVITK